MQNIPIERSKKKEKNGGRSANKQDHTIRSKRICKSEKTKQTSNMNLTHILQEDDKVETENSS